MHLITRIALTMTVAFAPIAAQAVPIVGGDTRVQVDAAFAGLVTGVTGSASVFSADPLIANFPITGGDLDGALAGQILHEGSGITLSAGGPVLGVGNFIIDTVSQTILADITVDGAAFAEDFALLSFDLSTVTFEQLTDLGNPALALFLTDGAADAIEDVFGLTTELNGAQFGLAATAPALGVVPEPASWALMIAGFGLVGGALRRRVARSVAA